jgi:hypothetical protein
MMPATACRPDPVDLLLCDHHDRASQGALQAADATIYDHEGLSWALSAGANLTVTKPRLRRSDS